MSNYLKPLFLLLLLLSIACQNGGGRTVEEMLTAVSATTAAGTALPQDAPTEPPTTDPSPLPLSPTPEPPTAAPTAAPTSGPVITNTVQPTPNQAAAARYRVIYVASDDVLNIRSGPGVAYDVIGALAYNAEGVQVTGDGVFVENSTWLPIAKNSLEGWVNGRFLTTAFDPQTFCASEAAQRLIDQFQTAVAQEDGALLANLIHPERGLRVRLAWWNPEVRLEGDGRLALFTNETIYDWGVQDGSGAPIVGTFGDIVLPSLQATVPAVEPTCNELIAGGTAGLVTLPAGYGQHTFASFHTPGTAQYDNLDWTTWLLGFEMWQGELFVSYLVLYRWEI